MTDQPEGIGTWKSSITSLLIKRKKWRRRWKFPPGYELDRGHVVEPNPDFGTYLYRYSHLDSCNGLLDIRKDWAWDAAEDAYAEWSKDDPI